MAAVVTAALALALLLVVFVRMRMAEREISGGPEAGAPEIRFAETSFAEIEGWQEDDQAFAFQALLRSCRKSSAKTSPQAEACAAVLALAAEGDIGAEKARAFFAAHYTPYRVVAEKPGLVTGYYEPEVEGARKKGGKFQVPVYKRPDDIVTVKPDELRARFNDQLTAMRKTDAGLVPYYTREEIDAGALDGRDLELLYLADPVELFFMQVQGSGRVRLPDGTYVRIGYAGKNGHPFASIGKLLLEREKDKPKGSMQGIKAWLRADPERGKKLMWENRSYVFFEERSGAEAELGPTGAQGVALTPGRSLAVDASYHALGTPIFVAAETLKDENGAPFRRLMVAQDVGSAIRGRERGDIFWGSGDAAGAKAGTTLAPARFIVLKPKPAPGS